MASAASQESLVEDAGINCQEAQPTAYDTPPDGGIQAWLQVAGSFFLFFNSWGTVNTFGVFQTYYETNLLQDQSASNISWIGAIQAFLLLLVGVITGPLYDAGYFRALLFTGSALIVIGFMTLSVCSQYWQVLLAQAICIGVGNGCLYIPSVAIIPQYFFNRKAIATGIAASGSSVGGVLYPIVFRQLQPQIGFPWATRILGFLALATCSFSLCTMRLRQMPDQRRVLLEFSAFKEAPYALFCLAMFFGYIGFFNIIFYIQPYALRMHAMGEHLAFYLVPLLNAASVPGRIVPGLLGSRLGPLNILLVSACISGALCLCWIAIYTSGGLIALAILYGFFSGAFVSLPAVALTTLTPDFRSLGTRMGMCSVLCGLGSLCGSPVAGAILDKTGSYLGTQLYSGITICATGVLLFLARICKTGTKLRATA
ncbi:monocarboxylate permease-like protein, mch4 [Xylona heveae TC161]|uniref:Monocarboxylate permease-like protein, mch4 n=1 Tax=Xylona heveae (strain CBS 132557 / TC161) TaxID=1328760 RepID=A0A165FGT9_XYLHT|nr:monocarboxylate permease-like protein, mch4 [Xylona heveae TC161]KZF20961.1 monocarboxylate permease-like protein, mch4 [Xylona heveae TC161]